MRRVALALLFACALAAPAAASASTSLETGIADDRLLFGDPDGAAVPPREFHPADPGEPRYDWTALDRAVRLVRGAGLQV